MGTRTAVALTSQVPASRSSSGWPAVSPVRSATASPIRAPVASIQSTMSGRSRSFARALPRNSSTSRAVWSTVSARGAFLAVVSIRTVASRTGLAVMAPSSMAWENIPDKQARAVLAAPGPLAFAIAVSARPTRPGVTSCKVS
nr:hypothetical protein [Modestobacter marinus]